jgi:hypothetical protein
MLRNRLTSAKVSSVTPSAWPGCRTRGWDAAGGNGRGPEQGEVGERHVQRLDGGVEEDSTPVRANAEVARQTE